MIVWDNFNKELSKELTTVELSAMPDVRTENSGANSRVASQATQLRLLPRSRPGAEGYAAAVHRDSEVRRGSIRKRRTGRSRASTVSFQFSVLNVVVFIRLNRHARHVVSKKSNVAKGDLSAVSVRTMGFSVLIRNQLNLRRQYTNDVDVTKLKVFFSLAPTTSLLLERILELEERLELLSSKNDNRVIVEDPFVAESTSDSHSIDTRKNPSYYPTPPTSTEGSGYLPPEPDQTPIVGQDTNNQTFMSKVSHHGGLPMDHEISNEDGKTEQPHGMKRVGGETMPTGIHAIGYPTHIDTDGILPLVEVFLDLVCPLFPIICDQVLHQTASMVAARGLMNDLSSCIVLLVMTLARVYSSSATDGEGVAIFGKAVHLLGILPVQLTLEYAQSQILCALFFMKGHRLLDSWHWLHVGCSTLYSMIKR